LEEAGAVDEVGGDDAEPDEEPGEGLAAGGLGLAHNLVKVSVPHAVQFVHDAKGAVQAVQRVRVPRKGLKL